MQRLLRRFVMKYFGGTRNFVIWTAAVILTIYFIDSYVLTRERIETLVVGPNNSVQKQVLPGTGGTQAASVQQQVAGQGQPGKLVNVAKPPEAAANPAVNNRPADSAEAKPKCGNPELCPAGKYAYHIKSGTGKDGPPTICFDGETLVSAEKNNGHRGFNIAVVDDKTHKVVDVRYFDTYVEEGALVRYLKLGIEQNQALLIATMDEASSSIKDDGKQWLGNYGSSLISKLGFRDSMVMIGQRGLAQGSAIEKMLPRDQAEFADAVEMSGCISFPLGKVNNIEVQKAQVEDQSSMKVGEELPNCGVKNDCGAEAFPVHLYTGKGNTEGPKICVNGKYVLAKGLNDGGRGFNIVVINPKSKDVVRVGHFDTYAEDSSNLEIFLEMMNDKEIVLAVTHDDASKNLNVHCQKLFAELGSSMIEKMTFRDLWMFVGQKGIDGHSTTEQIEFAGPGGQFPKSIDRRVCVPMKLKGSKIKPDPLANKNERRRKFCAKYDGYGDFCEAEHIDDSLTPAPLTDKALDNHPIFNVPIIVIPGLNHNAVRMQLETLLMQPGIKVDMVTVMYDEKFDESSVLAGLFNFATVKLSSSTKYIFQVEKALEGVWDKYPSAKHVIVLEEEVILGPDFLHFMAQCLPAVEKDDTLIGISAWNENGYQGVSTDSTVAYRGDSFPGLGFLLKRTFYESQMKGNMEKCCRHRSWDGWFNGALNGREVIYPDVSRVYRRPYEGLSEQADFLTELFNRQRMTNLDAKARLKNAESLTASQYEAEIDGLIKSSTALDTSNVQDCLKGRGLGFYIPETSGRNYVIFMEQQGLEDQRILQRLCKCFRLFYAEGFKSRGLHKGMLRFTYKGNAIMLIGSATPFYKYMPTGYKPILLNTL